MMYRSKTNSYYHKIKIHSTNEGVFDEALSKLVEKARKYTFDLRFKKVPLGDGMMEVEFKLDVPVIKYGNYEYVATLERENPKFHGGEEKGPGNLVFAAHEHREEDFSRYFEDKRFRCDHCHLNRYRLEVHLFRDPATQQDLMVATACAREYFGINVASALNNIRRVVEGLNKKAKKMEDEDQEMAINRVGLVEFLTRMHERFTAYREQVRIPFSMDAFLTYWREQKVNNPKDRKTNNFYVAVHMFRPIKKYYGLVTKAYWRYYWEKVDPQMKEIRRQIRQEKEEAEMKKREEDVRTAQEQLLSENGPSSLMTVGQEGDRVRGKILVLDWQYHPQGYYGPYYLLLGADASSKRVGAFVDKRNISGSIDQIRAGVSVEVDGVVKGTMRGGEIKIARCYVRVS